MKRTPIHRKKPLRVRLKTCQSCGKQRKLWSAGLCRECADRKKHTYTEGEPITEALVDQVFSWLVRTLYPNYCHGCKNSFPYRLLQCSHLVHRESMLVRWDLRNAFPGCGQCNYYDRDHQILLAAECDKYYGVGTAEKIASYRHGSYNWAPFELEELHEIFSAALEEARKNGSDKETIRLRVIAKTKKVA